MSSPPSATPPPAADGPATPPGATGGVATAGAPAAHSLGATKAYGSGDTEVLALNDVTVAFPSGRFTAIMGPSGSGKSTLMHCMAGLDTLTAGQVFIGDTDLSTLSDKQRTLLRREHVGFVFQAFNLIPTLTASENITLPLDLGGIKPDQGWLDTVVNTVGLSDRLSHRPSELSGGQQQRVAVARAMATRPQIIFADEPTGNLDSKTSAEIMQLIKSLNEARGITVVMVTHDPKSAAWAKRQLVFSDGKIISDTVRA